MARSKEKHQETGIDYRHGRDFFEKLQLPKTLSLLLKIFPESNPVQHGLHMIKMHCPLPEHEDKKASFEINVVKGTAQCRSTLCQFYTHNLLDLLQRAKGWTAKDSLIYIQTESGMRLSGERLEREIEALDIHHWAYRASFAACTQHLRNCLSPPDDDVTYNETSLRGVQPSLDWLFKERGHDPRYIEECGYGLLPPHQKHKDLAEAWLAQKGSMNYAYGDNASQKNLNDERRIKIIKYLGTILDKIDAKWVGCPTFPTGISPTTPGRNRARQPTDEKEGNIFNFPGFTPDEPLGFYGLFSETFASFIGEEHSEISYLVCEGEHDVISKQERMLKFGKIGWKAIASCGNANSTDQLYYAGIHKIYLVPDEPSITFGKGDSYVQHRLESAYHITVYVFDAWAELAEGSPKDLDDALKKHGFEKCWKLFVEERERTYITADQWAINRAVAAITDLPETEIKQRTAKAAEFGQCVRHPALMAHYITEICRLTGLSPGVLRTEIVRSRDNEAGYILRIIQALREEFHVLHKEDNARGGTLTLFYKEKRRTIIFYVTDADAMIGQLSNCFGDMYTFFKDRIGLYGAGADENVEAARKTTYIQEGHKEIKTYLKFAMQDINKGVPTKQECIKVGQGLHYKEDPDQPGTHCGYFFNGRVVYKIHWIREEGKEPTIKVKELEGPSDGNYMFELVDHGWSHTVLNTQDLLSANDITLETVRSAVQSLYNMFNTCWRWKYQELDAQYLAWHLMSFSVQCAFTTKVILSFMGQTTSGKSTAMSVFSGSQYREIQLLEACRAVSNYTLASIYQGWDRSLIGMGLEEFEDDGDTRFHKGQQVGNITELLRQIIGDEGVSISRGSVDGKVRDSLLHTNVMTTSILKARYGQDENRRYSVETEKVEGLKDPRVAISEMFETKEYQDLKRIITLGLIKHIPSLVENHDSIIKELNPSKIASFTIPTRFLRNFVPMASVMKLFGEDYAGFIKSCCEARKEDLIAASNDTKSAALFERILRVPTIPVGENGFLATVSHVLAKPLEIPRVLNRARIGVYFNEEHQILIMDWVTILSPGGVLNRIDEYRNMAVRHIRHMFDQHPYALKQSIYTPMGVFDFLQTLEVNAKPHEISVAGVGDYVRRLRENKQQTPKSTEGNGLNGPSEQELINTL